jgi:hypothetical protein
MELFLRLGEILQINETNSHGKITEIARRTGLKRGQVAALIHNKDKRISKDALGRVVGYIIEEGLASDNELLGILFGRRPNYFWTLLSTPQRYDICMGSRQNLHCFDEVTVAADNQLQSTLIRRITGNRHRGWNTCPAGRLDNEHTIETRCVLAPTPKGENLSRVQKDARDYYRKFQMIQESKALIALGTVKSNLVGGLSTAVGFRNRRPFCSQDNIEWAKNRSCPFLVMYRPEDPQPPSVCGGVQLSRYERGHAPGIYYETPHGEWKGCVWSQESDAAVVYYRHQKSFGQLDVVLGGYSARGTRCLADFLDHSDSHKLWPPSYSDGSLELGVFVLQFRFRGKSSGGHGPEFSTDVIRLDPAVLRHRVRFQRNR